MILGLDFDGTWTVDPEFWNAFVELAVKRHGHKVVLVTGRKGWTEDMARYRLPPALPIVYAGLTKSKREMAEAAGWKVDVWIDDMPWMVDRGKVLLVGDDKDL
jgi:hypothetical protein